ncbi:MAG: hypothetical protein Q8Q19_08405, partial [Microbacterium sp.]|nr:hypothetical protein [Microbacterium sp.]
MTHTLPLPDFTHERVEVITGRRSGTSCTVTKKYSGAGASPAWAVTVSWRRMEPSAPRVSR